MRQSIYATSALKTLHGEAKLALAHRSGGLFVSGDPGSGKTFAADFLSQELSRAVPGLRPFVVGTHTNEGVSARNFYSSLVGDPTLIEKRPAKAKFDVTQRLIDRGRAARSIVLAIIDEVQALHRTDLLFLRDISNDLERCGVWLFTIMLGEKPSVDVFARSILSELPIGVADRFLWRRLSLASPSSVGEVREILKQVDEREDFAGWPTTRFFFPLAYDSGFRLSPQASHVVRAYKNNVLTIYDPYNTRQLFAGIRAALLMFSARDSEGWAMSADDWNSAFATCVRGETVFEERDERDGVNVEGLPS